MKKELKKQMNRTVRSVFIYHLILVGVSFLYILWKSAGNAGLTGVDAFSEQMLKYAMDKAGLLSLAGMAAGLLYMAVRYRKTKDIRHMLHEKKPMTIQVFLAAFCVFMSCQVLFAAASSLAELLLNPFGYTLSKAAESASAVSTTFSMFFYSTLAGPIAEELVFRGYIMRRLLPFGKEFAIVISAVLFGLIHGNFLQGSFAMGAGLVLGYIAVEYSMKWSLVIHILNNLVFSDLMGRMSEMMAEPLKSVFTCGVPAAFFITAVLILFLNREKIKKWRKNNRIGKRYCLYAFTSVWMILFIIMEVMTAMNGVSKI